MLVSIRRPNVLKNKASYPLQGVHILPRMTAMTLCARVFSTSTLGSPPSLSLAETPFSVQPPSIQDFGQQLRNEVHEIEYNSATDAASSSLSLPVLAQHFTTLCSILASHPCHESEISDFHSSLTLLNTQLHHSLTMISPNEEVPQWLGQILHAVTKPINTTHINDHHHNYNHNNSHLLTMLDNELLQTIQSISQYVNMSVYGPTPVPDVSIATSVAPSYVNILDDEEPTPSFPSVHYHTSPLNGAHVASLLNHLSEVVFAPITHKDHVYNEHIKEEILKILSVLSDRLREK
jgi:hypothetical protein